MIQLVPTLRLFQHEGFFNEYQKEIEDVYSSTLELIVCYEEVWNYCRKKNQWDRLVAVKVETVQNIKRHTLRLSPCFSIE
jgi:hypothetical protein